MICQINVDKLRRFTKRSEIKPTEVNLLSYEGADHAMYLVAHAFSHRGGRYHLRFWVGGSPTSKGHIVGECVINKNKVIFLGE